MARDNVTGGPTYAIARNQLNDSEFCGQAPGPHPGHHDPWEKYLG
jgi:hypothetical protein